MLGAPDSQIQENGQRYGDAGKLGKRLLRLGRLMIHCHNRWKSGRYQDALYRHRIERFKQAIHQTLEGGGRWRQVQSGKPTQTHANRQPVLAVTGR